MGIDEKKWLSDFEEKVLRGYFDDVSPEDWFTISITDKIIKTTKQQCFECGRPYKESRCAQCSNPHGCSYCHLQRHVKNG